MDEKIQGIQELTDEELDNVSGGGFSGNNLTHEFRCPKCKRKYIGNKKNATCEKCQVPLKPKDKVNSFQSY